MTRRELIAGAAASAGALLGVRALAQGGGKPRIRLGICDWDCGVRGPAALDVARDIGLDGIQISPDGAGDRLSYAGPNVQAAYRKRCRETGVAIASVALTLGNEFPIASDPRAPAWIQQSVDAAYALGCKTVLLAFFSNGDLTDGPEVKSAEVDAVVARLKAAAPHAREKGVTLGIESYLSAADLRSMLTRVGSDAVGVYYDTANSTARGYDVPAEVRALGRRICEIHFKDYKGPLGTSVDLPGIGAALRAVRYQGWVVLENLSGPERVAYFRNNADIARRLFRL